MRGLFWAFLLAVMLGAAYVAMGDVGNGQVSQYSNAWRLGSDGGTMIDLISARRISFVGATTGTATLTGAMPGDIYLIVDGWADSSATTGTVTYAVTTGTITATAATATTGTLNLLIVGIAD